MSSFFSKCSKFDEDFKNWEKNWENIFSFSDNCIWYNTCRVHIYPRKYLWSGVNNLIKTRKSSNIIKRQLSRVSLTESDNQIWYKYSHGHLTSVLHRSTCWPWKGAMTRCYLNICVKVHSTVGNFENTYAARVIFIFKMIKIWCRLDKLRKMLRKCL